MKDIRSLNKTNVNTINNVFYSRWAIFKHPAVSRVAIDSNVLTVYINTHDKFYWLETVKCADSEISNAQTKTESKFFKLRILALTKAKTWNWTHFLLFEYRFRIIYAIFRTPFR